MKRFRFGSKVLLTFSLLVLTIFFLAEPVAKGVLNGWFERDMLLRSRLIGSSLDDGIIPDLGNKNAPKVVRQFEKIVRDDRIHSIGFCNENDLVTNATKGFFEDYKCHSVKSEDAEKGEKIYLPSGESFVSNRVPIFDEKDEKKIGDLIVVHDTSYVERRVSDAGKFFKSTALVFILISIFAALILLEGIREYRLNLAEKVKKKAVDPLEIHKRRAQIKPSACVSVVIPALNEEKRISSVVSYALSDPATAEVIVVDDSSTDDTVNLAKKAGARVITSSMLGKGASMQDGVYPARADIIVYLDGDLAGLRPNIISDLCLPILSGDADFVKARFGRGGGRVTELTAKPMLKIFFPELAKFSQPLGGIIAGRKSLFQALSFEDGYGVDIALLIDAHLANARIEEVDIGSLEHDSQPLHDLALMVNEVSRVIFSRAKAVGRLNVEQVASMFETQRQAGAEINYILTKRKNRKKLLLLDMDGTITSSRYVKELAKITGHLSEIESFLDNPENDAVARSEKIAKVFQYVHYQKFSQAARQIELRPGVIEFVNYMKRQGYFVGIVSDSYFVASEIVRRRIFADFSLAHILQFEGDVCTGQIRINPAFVDNETDIMDVCKSRVLEHFLQNQDPKFDETIVVGDNVNDLRLMKMADKAFVIEPKSSIFDTEPSIIKISSFNQLLNILKHDAASKAA